MPVQCLRSACARPVSARLWSSPLTVESFWFDSWLSCLQLLSKRVRAHSHSQSTVRSNRTDLHFSENRKTCCSSKHIWSLVVLSLSPSQLKSCPPLPALIIWRSYRSHWCIEKAIIQNQTRLSQWAPALLSVYDRLTNHIHNSFMLCSAVGGSLPAIRVWLWHEVKRYLIKMAITSLSTAQRPG